MTGPTDARRRALRAALGLAAEGASRSLSRWLGREVRATVAEEGRAGPGPTAGAACAMGLTGALGGSILLRFDDRSGLALADLILARPAGTAVEWGEEERSAAMETANIAASAYLNALAAHVPGLGPAPTPPTFLREPGGGPAGPALAVTTFEADGADGLAWTLVFAPDAPSLAALAAAASPGAPMVDWCSAPPGAPEGGMKRLLIVDDALFMRRLIAGVAREAGWDVAGEAGDGEQAVAMYAGLRPDLTTMDLVMPVMGGLEALRRIRELDPEARVVVVTAVDQKPSVMEAIRLGAVDFVVKPFDRDRLAALLRKLAGRDGRPPDG